MELLKVLGFALCWATLVCGAEPISVQRVKVTEGACRLMSLDSDRLLSRDEAIHGTAIYSTDVDSAATMQVKDGCVITFGEESFLRFNSDKLVTEMIKGHFEITCEHTFNVSTPQGEITFRPGNHVVILDSEKLILKTNDGSPATLSTPDVVRHTKKGWQIVSLMSGGFSLVKIK